MWHIKIFKDVERYATMCNDVQCSKVWFGDVNEHPLGKPLSMRSAVQMEFCQIAFQISLTVHVTDAADALMLLMQCCC